MNTEIIPAIMPRTFEEIEDLVGLVKNSVVTVQLDLMDGKFSPEPSWPFFYGTDRNLVALESQDISLPYWEEINYELDLMVERPEERLDTWLGIGAARVIFHYASIHDWEKIKKIDLGVRNFIELGLAITLHDDFESICTLIDDNVVDFIQVMGIAQIGYQGEPFEEESLEIISNLRERYSDITISVDGGVSLDTIGDLYDAGVNRFVSGSSVYGSGSADENIEQMKSLIAEV
jgi:ribulose-phosphate 3-epimerase